jgi:hypothetical protein
MIRSSKAFALVCALALSGAAGMTTATAATADTVMIVSAGSPAANVGQLTVVVDSTTPLTNLTVALSGTSFAPTMTETSSSNGQSTWQATPAITTAQLALGDYTIAVTASDSATTISDPDAGTLVFKDEPSFTVTPPTATVSYGHESATVSGQVTITPPGGAAEPYSDQPVTMVSSFAPDVRLATNDDGDFSVTVSPHVTGDWVAFQVGTSTVATGQSADSTFTVHVDPVKLTTSVSAKSVTYGHKITVSGTVSYQPGKSYVPLPGARVDVYDEQNPNAPIATGTANSAGHYTIAVAPTATTQLSIETRGSAYLEGAGLMAPMVVNLPMEITGFHASLNQYWQLGFGGCLSLAENIPDQGILGNPPQIQYAYYPKGPWYTLPWRVLWGGNCGHGGLQFSGTDIAPVNYAYYRAYYPGSPGSAPTGDDGATAAASGPVLAWKYADRLTSFSVSSKVVSKGGKLTVRGALQYYYGGWHAYGGQLVYVILRQDGSGTWYWIARVKTNGAGRFSATVTDPYSATWSAAYYGNSTHLSAGAAEINVRLKG